MDGGPGLGLIFRARTEEDAELFMTERAERVRHRRRTRAETVAILAIAVITLMAWGIAALVG